MKEKLFMYPGYDDEHNLKAIEMTSTVIFGFTGRGKTVLIQSMLEAIKEHNPLRECDAVYYDGIPMDNLELMKVLKAIKDDIDERLKYLRDNRIPTSIPNLIRKEENCPFTEVVYTIDGYNRDIYNDPLVLDLLLYILTNDRVSGVHLIMSFQTVSTLNMDVLLRFQNRICLETSVETYMAVVAQDLSKEFDGTERYVIYSNKGDIIRKYVKLKAFNLLK